MDLVKGKLLEKIHEGTLIQCVQVACGLVILSALSLDFLLTGKFINQYLYLFIFLGTALISGKLTDSLIFNLGQVKFSVLKNEIQRLGFPIHCWKKIPKPLFLEVEYEERAVIESWVSEIRNRYILNWYGPIHSEEPSKFVAEVEEELSLVFLGLLKNLQTRNWENFLIKLTNLLILHIKRKGTRPFEPLYRHPILMKTISEHDYYVSAISALLDKFGNRTKYTKYANSMFCSLHHLVVIEILANQLVSALSYLTSNSNRRKSEPTQIKKDENVDEEGSTPPDITNISQSKPKETRSSSLEDTHIKIIEGSPKGRPSISLPNVLNKSSGSESELPTKDSELESNQDDHTQAYSMEFDDEIYQSNEESEDLESAISKLRQLFEEKENDFVEKSKESNLKIPSDGRIFFNVHLSSEATDTYLITYDAVIINKTSSIVPTSNQFEYTTKTMEALRSYDEFIQLEKELRKRFHLDFTFENDCTPIENQEKYDMESLKNWLESLIHHYEASTSIEVKQFLKYPTDEIDIQNGKTEKGQRIDKFLAKTVSGVFNSIKDRLPNFEEADTLGLIQEEEVETIDISSEDSVIFTDIKDRLDSTEDSSRQLQLPVNLNFFPMANELSELEINLNCAIHEEVRQRKDQRYPHHSIPEGIIFQRGDNYKKFIEKEMFKDELKEGLTDKLVQLAVLIIVNEMNGKFSWLKSQVVVGLAKSLFSTAIQEVLDDLIISWTNENAWKAIFVQLRQILWYEDYNVSSSWLEGQDPIVRRVLKNAFSSKEANRDFVHNVTDLILSTVLKDDG